MVELSRGVPENTWPPKYKRFTVWPFRNKLPAPWSTPCWPCPALHHLGYTGRSTLDPCDGGGDRTLFNSLSLSQLCPPQLDLRDTWCFHLHRLVTQEEGQLGCAILFEPAYSSDSSQVLSRGGRAAGKLLFSHAQNENWLLHKRGRKRKKNTRRNLTKGLSFFPPDLMGLSLPGGQI